MLGDRHTRAEASSATFGVTVTIVGAADVRQPLAQVRFPHALLRRLGSEEHHALPFVQHQPLDQHQADEGLTEAHAVAQERAAMLAGNLHERPVGLLLIAVDPGKHFRAGFIPLGTGTRRPRSPTRSSRPSRAIKRFDQLIAYLRSEMGWRDRVTDATLPQDESLEANKGSNPFLHGVPAILDALRSGQIECRVYDKDKFHAKRGRPTLRDSGAPSSRRRCCRR